MGRQEVAFLPLVIDRYNVHYTYSNIYICNFYFDVLFSAKYHGSYTCQYPRVFMDDFCVQFCDSFCLILRLTQNCGLQRQPA
jgi:hypothetical protein